MVEHDWLIEIAVSVSTVVLMIGIMVGIGTTYGGESGILPPEGARLLVGAIVGFIVLLTGIGIGLAYVMNDPEDDLDGESDDLEAQNAA
ncbi:DUF7472 family protein [Halopiger djelfimassiliensis]|uniref:DUF7472 family protein n=1 Tax=Halopiger djelfimassiliensis TaxID=1293047 RepID=UPI0006781F15|nr:hypothetical protein [Halopiger djelfimassiliensis]